MRIFNHTSMQPFKKGDVVRQYHNIDMADDFLVTYAHSNGALDVVRHGVTYGLSARFSELSPNQDPSVGYSKKKRIALKICGFLLNILEKKIDLDSKLLYNSHIKTKRRYTLLQQ